MGKAGGIKMGWDSRAVRWGEKVDVAKEVAERYTWDDAEPLKVVRGSRIHGETPYYIAVKQKSTGEVWAGVCLTKVTKSDVWIKTMDETCGPGAADAKAAAIFPFLTETKSQYAKEWREAVKTEAAKPPKQKVVQGNIVRFAQPIAFSFGEYSEFRFVSGSLFRLPNSDNYSLRYKITNWRQRDYEVVA
jgi:hypothetical protein